MEEIRKKSGKIISYSDVKPQVNKFKEGYQKSIMDNNSNKNGEEKKFVCGVQNKKIDNSKMSIKTVQTKIVQGIPAKEKDKVKEELVKKVEEEKNVECDICFDQIDSSEIISLDNCKHLYHLQCLLQHFENMIEERKLPLDCPSCRIEVTTTDVRKFLPLELVRKWEDYSFQRTVDSNPKDYSYCPTPGCPYVFIWEEGKDSNLFECPQCENVYCLNCKCKYHEGQTCEEYRNSKESAVICLHIILGRG